MSETLDLFPNTVPPADPLVGKAVCIAPVCGRCGTNVALINRGRGPHAAELRCRNCDAHYQWLAHADYQAIGEFVAEISNQFGAPQEIIYRLPSKKTETDMASGQFDNTNHGVLFKNTNKTDDKHADYRGELNVAGVEHWLKASSRLRLVRLRAGRCISAPGQTSIRLFPWFTARSGWRSNSLSLPIP
jgi:hypothetical protein